MPDIINLSSKQFGGSQPYSMVSKPPLLAIKYLVSKEDVTHGMLLCTPLAGKLIVDL
jgi:hypothetical protein